MGFNITPCGFMNQFFDCMGSVECILHVLIFKIGNLCSSVKFDDRFTHTGATRKRGRIIFISGVTGGGAVQCSDFSDFSDYGALGSPGQPPGKNDTFATPGDRPLLRARSSYHCILYSGLFLQQQNNDRNIFMTMSFGYNNVNDMIIMLAIYGYPTRDVGNLGIWYLVLVPWPTRSGLGLRMR